MVELERPIDLNLAESAVLETDEGQAGVFVLDGADKHVGRGQNHDRPDIYPDEIDR